MSGLPESWLSLALVDVAETGSGGTPLRQNAAYFGGAIPWFKSGELSDSILPLASDEMLTLEGLQNSSAKYFSNGTVLMAMYGATVGKLGILQGDATTNQAICGISPKPVLENRFLFYFLLAQRNALLSKRAGGAQPNINQQVIRNLIVPLPPPAEQRRIVAEIEKQFTRLDETESILRTADGKVNVLTKSFLHQLLTGRLGDSRLPTRITELGTLDRGRSRHRPRDDRRLFDGPYPFIQTAEVRAATHGRIRDYSATYSQSGLDQSRLWPAGTLCITIAANIAETGILDFDACFPDSVVGFTGQNEFLVKWVELFFRIEKHRLAAFAPATAQKNINLEILRSLRVPMPRIEELPEILGAAERILSVVETHRRSIKAQAFKIRRLRQSILAKAFSGQLIPQDSNDEPASVLRERIRVQRGTPSKPAVRRPRTDAQGLTLQS